MRRGRRTGDVGAAAADRVAPAPLVCERGRGVRPRAGRRAPRFRLLARSQVTAGAVVLAGAAGGATGSGTTTLEAALVADVEPTEFEALTTTRSVRPTSPATSAPVAGGGGAAQVDAAPARGVATTPLVAVPRRRVGPGTGRRAQRLGLLGSARDRGGSGVRGRLERRRRGRRPAWRRRSWQSSIRRRSWRSRRPGDANSRQRLSRRGSSRFRRRSWRTSRRRCRTAATGTHSLSGCSSRCPSTRSVPDPGQSCPRSTAAPCSRAAAPPAPAPSRPPLAHSSPSSIRRRSWRSRRPDDESPRRPLSGRAWCRSRPRSPSTRRRWCRSAATGAHIRWGC